MRKQKIKLKRVQGKMSDEKAVLFQALCKLNGSTIEAEVEKMVDHYIEKYRHLLPQ